MSWTSETIQYLGKTISFLVLFEAVDDPQDASKFFDHIKPIDVWIFIGKTRLPENNFTLEAIQEHGRCIGNVTKATPSDYRSNAIKTFANGFLHVIATPTPEWDQLYDQHIYLPIPVESGRRYNFAVSLPAKKTSSSYSQGAPSAT